MKQRLAPFLVLLEARYAPLLFAVAPQSYAVYLWLFPAPYNLTGEAFAVAGALGYELVYVGAIAWAEEDRASFWTWATAVVALVFSILVAYHVYQAQGAWAWLHAGFPVVAFSYTLNMYSKRHLNIAQTLLETLPERSSGAEQVEVGNDAAPTNQAFLDELLATVSEDAQPPQATTLEPLYTCEHCGSALASKQAKGSAARFGCSNVACPGRANRKVKVLR